MKNHLLLNKVLVDSGDYDYDPYKLQSLYDEGEFEGDAMFYTTDGYDPKPPYPRPEVDAMGDMFVECKYCKALKLKPLPYPIPSPGEATYYKMCCDKGKVDIQEESLSPLAVNITTL